MMKYSRLQERYDHDVVSLVQFVRWFVVTCATSYGVLLFLTKTGAIHYIRYSLLVYQSRTIVI